MMDRGAYPDEPVVADGLWERPAAGMARINTQAERVTEAPGTRRNKYLRRNTR